MAKAKAASRLDLLIVYKAIAHAPPEKMSAAAKAICSAILTHFNEDTGQCDPGAERLRGMLGVNRTTVFRAIAQAVEFGIFERKSYGGTSHRNLYVPNWSRCHALAKEADANRRARGTVKVPPERSRQKDGAPSRQEDTNFQLNKLGSVLQHRKRPSLPQKRGHAERGKPNPQGYLKLPLQGGKASQAAEAAAHRRLVTDIAALPDPAARERAWQAAIEAETGSTDGPASTILSSVPRVSVDVPRATSGDAVAATLDDDTKDWLRLVAKRA